MSKTNDGGPAFPNAHFNDVHGMSKRELFAAHALTGILAYPLEHSLDNERYVEEAFRFADLMIAHVQKSQDNPGGIFAAPVESLRLCVRARRGLRVAGISSVGQLVEKHSEELLSIKNFGYTTLGQVREALAMHGLTLRGEAVDPKVKSRGKK